MPKDEAKTAASRREFFRKAGLSAGAAAIGAATAGASAPAAQAAPASQGYRETAHVKKYYALSKAF